MVRIEGVIDGIALLHVVQIGTRHQPDRLGADSLVVVLDQRTIGPGLIGGMVGLPYTAP